MQRVVYVLLMTIALQSCQLFKHAAKEPVDVPMTTLRSGYFLRNDIIIKDRLHCMIATNQKMIDKYFGYGAVMGDSHTHPDFKKNYVLAMAMKATNQRVELSFAKAELVKDELKVYCSVKELDEHLSYEATPMVMATIKRNAKIRKVLFYEGGKLVRRVVL